jgi:hypothetical protein
VLSTHRVCLTQRAAGDRTAREYQSSVYGLVELEFGKMNKNMVRLSFAVIMLLLAGCSPASQALLTPSVIIAMPAAATPELASTAPLTLTQSPTDTPMPAQSPTSAPTLTPSRPVFDPAALGDNRQLASFILTIKNKTTGGGEVTETKDTIGYIQEPFGAYHLQTRTWGHAPEQYLIGGRLYEKNYNENFWNVSPEPDPKDIDYYLQSPADMRWVYQTNFGAISAKFAGREDFQGIPANHFTFDQTDLKGGSDPTGTYKIEKASGDLYLAQDGNYLLRYHIKVTGNVYPSSGPGYSAGVREYTEELSSINGLKEITLPPDYLALKLELDLGLPVPAGTKLHAIAHSTDGTNYSLYDYFMPVTVSTADFLEFYKNLAPTNGWTVSQVGGKTKYDYCQDLECVILKKGNAQAVLYKNDICVSNMPANNICFYAVYYR